MGVRAAVVVVVVVLGVMVARVATAPQDDITLDAGGYSGVTVAISDQLDEAKCTQYINGIKDTIAAASQLMFSATGSKVFFKNVTIVVPELWACEGINFDSPARTYTWDSAHIRVSPAHHLFGDNPWTQQPGGCGYPGDWIYVSENFLLGNSSYGSQGSVLVHEWAKYRWGVFEEYGHISDPIFPSAYLDQNNEITPTYCTDHPLEGVLFCPDGGTEAECQFFPELAGNSTATSSLLAAPFLNTVVNFCDANSHNAAAPTKHNLLCDQRSAWDVMNQHSDMQGTQSSLTSTTFNVVRATAAGQRLVLLLDYSSKMNETRARWEQLRDNAVQFIMTEAAAEDYVGVVVFASQIQAYYPVVRLSVFENRVALAAAIPSSPPGETGDKDLYTAITRGTELLGAEGGTLVLVTHNLVEYTNTANLTAAADNNAVWPILYPCDASLSTTVYDQLAGISPDTSVLTVFDETYSLSGHIYQAIQNSADLHHSLMTAAASPASRVTSGSCTQMACTIPLNMTDSTEYISTAYIKVFYSSADEIPYFKVVVKPPSGGEITGSFNDTCAFFIISTLQTGQYNVVISGSADITSIVAELWATSAATLGLQVSVWSTHGLHDLRYLPGVAPPLFAKVTKNASWPVLYADITGTVTSAASTAVSITLNDAGFGGDVTGNDGIYSGYLVGFEPNMDISISLTVTDNNGAARVVNPSLRTAPTTPESGACCGSHLDVSVLQLEVVGNFTLSPAVASGRLKGESPGTFPPGRVTDLQGSSTGYDVTLTFTAPGAQLDQGTADGYEWKFQAVGEDPVVANFSGHPAGSRVELQRRLPGCDKLYTMTVEAFFGGVRGSTSNSVREIVPCSSKTRALSAGATAGITIGCILAVLLIVLIIYLCLNRDHLDELWVWQILTCRCLRKKEEDLYKQPTQARRTDVIRNNTSPSKPVRDLTDLYSRPNLAAKTKNQQNKAQDEDDGGFGERRRGQANTQKEAIDVESMASSHSTLPINQVGLPVGSDNHGYDDEPYAIYRNVPAPVRYPRANTQV